MTFTVEQQRKIDLFRASVRLQDPATERDPAYRFSDEDLWNILDLVAPVYSATHTIDTLPGNEFYFPLILAKKEIYYRLATSTAPFYPLEAEGAKLEKNVRFDHYMLLIRQTDREYRTMKDEFEAGDGVLRSYEAKILANYHSFRNYNIAEKQIVSFASINPKTESAEFTWTKFDNMKGLFAFYKLFVTTEPVIDEFAEYMVKQNVEPALHTTDIHRNKWRVENLLPDKEYIATIVSYDRNGLFGHSVQAFRTLP